MTYLQIMFIKAGVSIAMAQLLVSRTPGLLKKLIMIAILIQAQLTCYNNYNTVTVHDLLISMIIDLIKSEAESYQQWQTVKI